MQQRNDRRSALLGAFHLASVLAALAAATAGCDRGPAPKGPQPPTPVGAAPSGAGVSGARGEGGASGTIAPGAGAAAQPAAPGGPSQAGGFKVSGPDDDQTVIVVGGLVMPKPVTWVWTAPAMQFRALQYAVPANGTNAPAAELVFSVFPAGDGGPVDSNLDRWANQFRAEDNSAAPAKREQTTVNGMQVSRIESKGAYMGMGAAAPRPKHMQLGAIVQAPGRNIFMKLVGPEATVESNRAAFDAMVSGMKEASDAKPVK